jgi:hypothetical protein
MFEGTEVLNGTNIYRTTKLASLLALIFAAGV